MTNLLTNIGEEYVVENNINGESVTVGLYNDGTDAISDTSTLSDITTEPGGAAYARQSDTFTTAIISGDYGFDNDNDIVFDTSNSSNTVDHGFLVVNFTSDTVAGDTGATDHLIAVVPLSQSLDLTNVTTVTISAGELNYTLT